MVILHIFRSLGREFAGTDVVIPKHIKAQQKLETVGCVNITNVKIDGIENQFEYTEDFKISNLQEPFNKPDIIVFHQLYYPKFLKIAKEARKLNIPYIIIPHGSMTKQVQSVRRLKKIVGNIVLFNKYMKGAVAIQYLSEDEKARTFKELPCFISTNGLYMPSEQKGSFNEDKLVFSYIGRYDTHIKGLDLLVDAIKLKEELLRKNNCFFNLYGPQTEEYAQKINSLKDLITEKGVSDLVFINGPVLDVEKKETLLNTDIFIQCSRSEAMSMGIMEAMSYGLPVIVTYTTTMGTFVDKYDAGWSCQTTAEGIANAIEKALAQKHLLNEKSKNAITLVKENFLWDNVAKGAIENYEKLI